MFKQPKKSPWGKVKYCEQLYPGVFDVSTAEHGGIMVMKEIAAVILSPAAQKCGFKKKGFINFEEDTQAAVVERELLDMRIWEVPSRFENKNDYEKMINDSLKQYNPEYWQARENSMNKIVARDKPGNSLLAQVKENQDIVKNQNDTHITTKKEITEL